MQNGDFDPGRTMEDLEKFYFCVGKAMILAVIAANNNGVHPVTILKKYWNAPIPEGAAPPIHAKAVEFIVDFVSLKSGEMAPKWLKGIYARS